MSEKKMMFREFLEIQASLMPAVNYAPGSSGFYDLLRAWNTEAILHPERCADVVVWEKGGQPTTMANDLDLKDIQKTLKTKPLENLPDNLRTEYNPQKIAEQKRKEMERKKAEEEKQEQKTEVVDNEKTDETTKPVEDEEGITIPTHAQNKKDKGQGKVKQADNTMRHNISL